jgi:choline-sulfatase
MERALRAICDPEAIDRQAKIDQAALIERHGGAQAAFDLGRAVAGGTPAPSAKQSETATSGRPS